MKLSTILLAVSVVSTSNVASAEALNRSTGNGRFQMIQLSSMRRDQFMLDTQTGKIWERTCLVAGQSTDDCTLDSWKIMNVEGVTIDKAALADRATKIQFIVDHPKKEPSSAKPFDWNAQPLAEPNK